MSEMTIQPKNNNLNYLNDLIGNLFSHLKMEQIEHFFQIIIYQKLTKDFNVLIDGKCFFDLPGKNQKGAYEKIIEMSSNSGYTTGNLLDYFQTVIN